MKKHSCSKSLPLCLVIESALTAPKYKQRCLLVAAALSRVDQEDYCPDGVTCPHTSGELISGALTRRITEHAGWQEIYLLCRLLQSLITTVQGVRLELDEPVEHEIIYAVFLILLNTDYQQTLLGTETHSQPQKLLDSLISKKFCNISGAYCIDLAEFVLPFLSKKYDCPWHLRWHAVRVLEYLSARHENRHLLCLITGLVDTVSLSLFQSNIDETQFIPVVAKILLSIVTCEDNQGRIARSTCFMDTCIHILKFGDVDAKQHILLAIWRAANHPIFLPALLQFRKGAMVEAIATAKGSNSVITKALCVIQHTILLASSTSLLIHTSIQALFMFALCSDDNQHIQLVAYFFTKLSTLDFVHQDSQTHDLFAKVLVSLSNSQMHQVRLCAATCLLELSQQDMVEKDTGGNLTQSIITLSIQLSNDEQPTVRVKAFEAMAKLAALEHGARRILQNTQVVDSIISCISDTKLKGHMSRKLSIVSIDILIALSGNALVKHRIAKERGVIEALATLGSSCRETDRYLRNKALHGVILLAPLL
jgi:hypothetical protein